MNRNVVALIWDWSVLSERRDFLLFYFTWSTVLSRRQDSLIRSANYRTQSFIKVIYFFLFQLHAHDMLNTYIYHQLPPKCFGVCYTIFRVTITLLYYINPNKMHTLQSLFYLTTSLHDSCVTITHLQEHKTTVTTASGNHYTVIDRVKFTDKEYR
jgi:hypothetical protein